MPTAFFWQLIFAFISILVLSRNAGARRVEFPFQQAVSLPWDPSVIQDDQCKKDVEYWLASIDQYISWSTVTCAANDTQCITLKTQAVQQNTFAIKQIDSFGRIPADILDFPMRWQGSYEECLAVKGKAHYRTQFCWLGIAPDASLLGMGTAGSGADCNSTTQFQWSICMPRSCQNEDVTAFMDTLNSATNNMVNFCKADCRSPESPKKDAWFYIVTIYSGIALLLVVVASVVDYLTEKGERMDYSSLRHKYGVPALLTFSMYTNGAEILSTAKRPGQIDCLHCMRTVSMTWVLVGHVLDKYVSGDNPVAALQMSHKFLNDAFINAFPSVDTFFFIGGVLLAYLFYKEMDRNPRSLRSPIYWTLYYVHRILRLSPPYFLFLGFYVIVYPYFTKGPLDPATDIEMCKKYWWRNILYIQNFFTDSFCMGHTWYLSTDMLQHIFAPLLLVPLCLSLLAGGISAVLLLAMTIGATYGVYQKYHLPTTIAAAFEPGIDQDTIMNYFRYAYGAPWVRCSPVIIGVLTGYFLHKMHGRKFRLHWLVVVALWIVSAAMGTACVYGLYDSLRGKTKLSTAEKATYYAFHRIGWAISLAWVTIACHFNMAGPIKNFMELGFWAPFSRLTYCAYLTHYSLIDVILGEERTALHYVNTTEGYIHGGIPVMVISYLFAFLWSCCFEVPFGKLEKMGTSALLRKGRQREPAKHKMVVNESKNDAWDTSGTSITNGNVKADGQLRL